MTWWTSDLNLDIGSIAHVEVAALVAFTETSIGGKVSTPQEFNRLVGRLQVARGHEKSKILRLRHPWSVFGGTGGVSGQPPFKGFFQICLEESKF
jgi:hypothetical protein